MLPPLPPCLLRHALLLPASTCCLQARECCLAVFSLQGSEELPEPGAVGSQLGRVIDKVLGAVECPGDLKIVGLGGKAIDQGLEFVWHLGRVVQGQEIGDLNGAQRDFGASFHGGILHQRTNALCTFGKATGGKMLLHEIA